MTIQELRQEILRWEGRHARLMDGTTARVIGIRRNPETDSAEAFVAKNGDAAEWIPLEQIARVKLSPARIVPVAAHVHCPRCGHILFERQRHSMHFEPDDYKPGDIMRCRDCGTDFIMPEWPREEQQTDEHLSA